MSKTGMKSIKTGVELLKITICDDTKFLFRFLGASLRKCSVKKSNNTNLLQGLRNAFSFEWE